MLKKHFGGSLISSIKSSFFMTSSLTHFAKKRNVCIFMSGGILFSLLTRSDSTMAYLPGSLSIAYVTAPSEEVAKNLANGVVSEKLAACVNIVPKITSIYEWEGQITEDSEVLMIIKTRTSKVNNLTSYIKSNHPYKVCEVISTPIQNGNEDYLQWVSTVVPENSESS